MMDFAGNSRRLGPDDIKAAAERLECDAAVVHAVCDVESAGSGFLPDGRPKILFEAHLFYRLTKGEFGESNISTISWNRTLYGASGAHQYDRLAEAIRLDRAAALQSASWGMFQILGSNHKAAGYPDPESFVRGMMDGERNHLGAFISFCEAGGLDMFLQADPPDFASFARHYNGPGQVPVYSAKLAAAWRKYRASPAAKLNPAPRTDPAAFHGTLQLNSAGSAVRQLQTALGVASDGDFGPATMAAVVAFQQSRGLPADGIVGPATRSALSL